MIDIAVNIHHTPNDGLARVMSEHVASLNSQAIARAFDSSSAFDAAGMHYWAGDKDQFQNSCHQAFDFLRQAQVGLANASRTLADLKKKTIEVPPGLTLVNEEDALRYMDEELIYQERLSAAIEHLLLVEPTVLNAAQAGDLATIYTAVSVSVRVEAHARCRTEAFDRRPGKCE